MKRPVLSRRPAGLPVPNLVIAQRVLTRMGSAARLHVQDETGEALVGLWVEGESGVPTIYILDTISPDESALRLYHTFQQGDARQDELIWWLQENWRITRPTLTGALARFNVPLRYLGDWHKQPGAMIAPSDGDLATALEWIDDPDNNTDWLVAPIVTFIDAEDVTPIDAGRPYLTLPGEGGIAVRVDFWFIDDAGRDFTPIAPTIYPNDQLPPLAAYPWHLLDPDRFDDELRRLEEAGYFISVTLWDADGAAPLEICLLTGRVGSDNLLILVTGHDYPMRPAQARIAPLVPMGAGDDLYSVFAQAWAASQPVEAVYDPVDGLLGLARAAERKEDVT